MQTIHSRIQQYYQLLNLCTEYNEEYQLKQGLIGWHELIIQRKQRKCSHQQSQIHFQTIFPLRLLQSYFGIWKGYIDQKGFNQYKHRRWEQYYQRYQCLQSIQRWIMWTRYW